MTATSRTGQPPRHRRLLVVGGIVLVVIALAVAANIVASKRIDSALSAASERLPGNATLHRTSTPALAELATGRIGATLNLDTASLRALSTCGNSGGAAVTVTGGTVVATKTLTLGGRQLNTAVTLTPTVANGLLVLTPDNVNIDGLSLPASRVATLMQTSGNGNASKLLTPRKVGSTLPTSIHITTATVDGSTLRLGLTIATSGLHAAKTGTAPSATKCS